MMKILIVKLGAMGDVLRTTPLLTRLKKEHPGSRITWVVDARCREALEENPLIDRLLNYSPETLAVLEQETFDLAVNLDKDAEALDAIGAARAAKKMGFGRSAKGALCALDRLSDYAYRLGVDDELKFRKNKKSYQEISFEQLGLRFQKEDYLFSVDGPSEAAARRHLETLGFPWEDQERPVVGLNTGSGARFAGKKLPIETYLDLIAKFHDRMGAKVLLLGGKDEVERNREIERRSSFPVVNTGSHPIRTFAAIVRRCDLVVSGDTTAMHIAIAVKTPVVAYFASTCSAEIELYGRGKKVISEISCAPCYLRNCPIDEQCMKDMRAETLFRAAQEALKESVIASPEGAKQSS
ncbi:MAG: glycosyltransferase family 9 protein [Candidatus Omnitrophota bacterium]